MSDRATCRLTGTATLTTTGGTLTGFSATDDGTDSAERTVPVPDNLTNSTPNRS